MLNSYLLRKVQVMFCLCVVLLAYCGFCNAQDDDEPMEDSFNSNSGAPVDQVPSGYGPGAVPVAPYQGSLSMSQPDRGGPSTPDGTEDASRASGEFAKTLPNDPRGLVRVIKGLLQEHPPMSPHTWDTSYWRGRSYVTMEKLSFLAYPCYLAWYHTIVAYEIYLASGSPAANKEFQKLWAEAERVCNDESGDTSPPSGHPHTPSPSGNNKIPSSPPPSTDSYNSNSPPAAPPQTAPPETFSANGKAPPLAPQRGISGKTNEIAKQSPYHLQVEKHGPMLDELARQLDDIQNSIPGPLLALVQKRGFKVRAITSIQDYNPQLAKEQVPGYPSRLTYAQSDGYTEPNDRSINVAKYHFSPNYNPGTFFYPPTNNPDPAGTFRHEFGHALDGSLDNYSNSPAFQQAYEKDVNKIPRSVRSVMKYYFAGPENTNERYARSEAFAELIAAKLGGGLQGDTDTSLRKYLPSVSKLIDSEIEQLQTK